jgi:hypothetical protein
MYNPYPKWLYKGAESVLVKNEADHKAHAGWTEEPGKEPEPEPVAEEPVKRGPGRPRKE